MSFYKHILFATDLTEVCNKIAPKVQKLAELYGAKISLIHVIEPTPTFGYPGLPDIESTVSEHVQQAMAELADNIEVPRERQHIEIGSVKSQVLQFASGINADLIVVGSHGRHGLSRLLGSSASAIVSGAVCDVLLLRVPES